MNGQTHVRERTWNDAKVGRLRARNSYRFIMFRWVLVASFAVTRDVALRINRHPCEVLVYPRKARSHQAARSPQYLAA